MLVPRRLRLLEVDPRTHPRRQPHVSAASGIARVGNFIHVVADDEHHLACFDARDPVASPIQLTRFRPDDLPQDSAQRKASKPDVEVLLHLPAAGPRERDAVVLLGSGSRPQRERAFVMELHADGRAAGAAVEVPAEMFYAPVRKIFQEPNLEAACVDGEHVHVFHRANRGDNLNGRITYSAASFSAWLRGQAAEAPQPLSVRRFSLGGHEGVPFGITDAAGWSRPGCVFTVVAEDTADAYNDGACVASMVGWMDSEGQVRARELLAGAPKVEGVTPAGDGLLWMVTDTDDPKRPSELLEVEWAIP